MSSSKKKTKRPRTERRDTQRAAVKLATSKMRLASLEPGGAPDRPIEVTSASVVEPHAASLPCLACGESTRLEEHAAVSSSGVALRVARVRCPHCGTRREIWFRIGTTLPS